jgi:D-arabinose 1-dehydrogenase-like Zn-dependent alcohol dehydrogenase
MIVAYGACAADKPLEPLGIGRRQPGSRDVQIEIVYCGVCHSGGIAETQEMLDFCAANGIVADIEMIPIQKIDEAYDRMLKSDVKYRFVIDNASLANDG